MKTQQLHILTQLTDKENTHTHGPLLLSFSYLLSVFLHGPPGVAALRPLRWGEVRFGATALCHLDIHSDMLVHVHTYRYTFVITHTDKHLDLVTGARRRAEYCVHACVYKWGEWGIRGCSIVSAGGCLEVDFLFSFLFFCFWALEEGVHFTNSQKWRGGGVLLQYADLLCQIKESRQNPNFLCL